MCKNTPGCNCWLVWKPVHNLDLTSFEVMWQFIPIKPHKGQTQSQLWSAEWSMHDRKAFWWLCVSKNSKLNLYFTFIYLCRHTPWDPDFFLKTILTTTFANFPIDFSIICFVPFLGSIKCPRVQSDISKYLVLKINSPKLDNMQFAMT